MFAEFFSPYLDEFDLKLKKIDKFETSEINFNSVYEYLYTTLVNTSIRVLITELDKCREENLLDGQTSNERFKSFEKRISNNKIKSKLYEQYSVIDNILSSKVKKSYFYIKEILSNFNKDKENLKKVFGLENYNISNIELGKGDTHNGGKTVAIISIGNKKIVYKPHDLSPDIVFSNIINWINGKEKLNCRLRTVKLINMGTYGWQEFIAYEECHDLEEVKNYYYRCGSYLALFTVLGTTDIHFENVIVNKDNPYFVDLETLIDINNPSDINSVINTGFIPNKTSNNLFDVDVSGLCGKMEVSSKLKSLAVVNPKTDKMHLDFKPAKLGASCNIVKLNSRSMCIEDYVNTFLDGFNNLYDLLVSERKSFRELIHSILFEKQVYRQVLRHTQVYAKYIEASLHPSYLVNSSKQQELFKRLELNCKNKKVRDRVKNEAEVLLQGDIPYFYSFVNSKNLYANGKLICKDYFDRTIIEKLDTSIDNISTQNKKFQMDIIRKSLFTVFSDPLNNTKLHKLRLFDIKENNHENMVIEILDSIQETFLEDSNDQGIACLINRIIDNKVSLSSINFNLYEGGGLIWTFACAGKYLNRDAYRTAYEKLLNSALIIEDHIKLKEGERQRVSAFFGTGSLLYLYYNLAILYDDNNYYFKVKAILNDLLNCGDKYLEFSDNYLDYDYVCGISSILVLIGKVYIKTKREELKEVIENLTRKYSVYLIDYINRTGENINQIGLAHGLSGYAYALIMTYSVIKDKKALELAKKILKKENNLYIAKPETVTSKTSWCNSETGMLLVRNELFKIEKSDQLLKEILEYFDKVVNDGFYNINNMCLCHGVYGNIDVATEVISSIGDKLNISSKEIYDFESRLLNNKNDIQLGLQKNFILDTFMCGSSGIAFEKLRMLNPEIPSVMSLNVFDES